MPTFDFTSPDGKSYSVDGPDGATKEQAFQILQQQLGNASPPQVGIGEDLAKSAASIPGRILASAAGLPADIAHLYATNPNDANPLGSEALKKDLHSDYQAQRLPGQLTQTAGDFLPAVVGGPETLAMKLATRVAAPTIASEAAGAVTDNPWVKAGAGLVGMGGATAAARQLENMAAARTASAALPKGDALLKSGSAGFDAGRDMNIVVKPDFATNTAGDIRAALKDFDAEDTGVKDVFRKVDRLEKLGTDVPPQAETIAGAAIRHDGKIYTGANHVDALESAADATIPKDGFKIDRLTAIQKANPGIMADENQGFVTNTGRFVSREEASKIAENALQAGPSQSLSAEKISGPGVVPPAQGVSMNDIENVRKQLSKLRMSSDASTREAAKRAQLALTKSQGALTSADVLSGDAPLYAQTMRNAVLDYGAGKRMATLQGKMNLAELNHGTPVGLLDNASHTQAIQRTMKQLARPVNNTDLPVARKLGFNNEETGMIKNIALGNKWTRSGEYLDRLLPAKLGAIPAAIARQIGSMSINRQVATLDSLVRSRSALAAQVASQLPPQVLKQLPAKTQRILQALKVANTASGSQIPQQIGQAIGQTGPQ